MKRTALLPVVVAFLLFGASSARASPLFTLTLIDVTGGTQTTLTAPSLIVGSNITVGQFRVSGATGFLQEPAGSVTLNLAQLTVSDTNPTPGAEFKAVLSLTGVDPGALGLGSNALATVTSTSNVPVLYTGAATVTAASWVDPTSNGSETVPGSLGALSTGGNASLGAGPVSLYTMVDVVFNSAAQNIAGTSSMKLVAAPVTAPEPGTTVLFGFGLFGLAWFGRSCSRKGEYQRKLLGGVVTKKTVTLSIFAALLLVLTPAIARANSVLTLTMTDVTHGGSATVTGDSSYVIFSGSVGSFDVVVDFGTLTYNSAPLAPVELNLNSFLVYGTSGEFLATLAVSDISSGALGSMAQALVSSTVELNGSDATVNISNVVDTTNGGGTSSPPAPGVNQNNITSNVSSLIGTSAPFALSGPFSMYSSLDINFGSAGMVSVVTDNQVINAVAAPEPGTLGLFGSGLLLFGFASFSRRRSRRGSPIDAAMA